MSTARTSLPRKHNKKSARIKTITATLAAIFAVSSCETATAATASKSSAGGVTYQEVTVTQNGKGVVKTQSSASQKNMKPISTTNGKDDAWAHTKQEAEQAAKGSWDTVQSTSSGVWEKTKAYGSAAVDVLGSKDVAFLTSGAAAYMAYQGNEKAARVLSGVSAVSNGMGAISGTGRSTTERFAAGAAAISSTYAAASKGEKAKYAAYGAAGVNVINAATDAMGFSGGEGVSAPDSRLASLGGSVDIGSNGVSGSGSLNTGVGNVQVSGDTSSTSAATVNTTVGSTKVSTTANTNGKVYGTTTTKVNSNTTVKTSTSSSGKTTATASTKVGSANVNVSTGGSSGTKVSISKSSAPIIPASTTSSSSSSKIQTRKQILSTEIYNEVSAANEARAKLNKAIQAADASPTAQNVAEVKKLTAAVKDRTENLIALKREIER